MPAHFGNSFECMADYEMKELLSECKYWGFNAYSDWFDSADLIDPYNNPKNSYLLPQALLSRKMSSFKIASKLGLELDIGMTPNHVYLNQLDKELLATPDKEGKMFGQLLCPSNSRARKIILNNHRNLFEDFAKRGLPLSSLSACPYDYGGCACKKCEPWVISFMKLFLEIGELAEKFFGKITLRLTGWWVTEQEQILLRDWLNRYAPGRVASFAAHIKYGECRPANAPILPDACDLHAFIHIGYGDVCTQGGDVYGKWGAVCAPNRLEKTISELTDMGATGFVAYDEGAFDDVNRAILAGISAGKHKDSSDCLKNYVKRYFGMRKEQNITQFANWLMEWGNPEKVDLKKMAATLNEMKSSLDPSDWRFAQWEKKLHLYLIDSKIRAIKGWTNQKEKLANTFFETRDRLYREVWKLGPVRHVLNPIFTCLTWLEDYKKHISGSSLKRVSTVHKEA
jgi:hypothetical protein